MSLARVPFLRLARSLQTWLSVAGWSALVLGSAWLERRRGAVHGVDHALDLYVSIAVPLLVYVLVSVAVGAESLAGSGRAILTLGARPLRVALATVLVTAAVSAVLAGGWARWRSRSRTAPATLRSPRTRCTRSASAPSPRSPTRRTSWWAPR